MANTFLHTVDKRATPAIWRESVEKNEFDDQKKKGITEISVEELIAARHREIQDMVAATQNQFEMRMGSERYEQILRLSSIEKEKFNLERRKHWKIHEYIRYAGRMLVLMLKCFKNRKQYVAEMEYSGSHKETVPIKKNKRSSKNKDFVNHLTCQPEYRTAKNLETISFYLRPLTKLMILFPTDMHSELCRRVTYTSFDHGRIITHQGRKPQRFYFILDGKVNKIKMINLKKSEDVAKSVGWMTKGDHSNLTDMENYSPTEFQLVSVGTSQLLYLNIDDFIYLRKVNERVPRLFLSTIPLFKEYPLEVLLEQAGAIVTLFFEPNKTVCKNLKSTEYFYICKSGECAIIRRQKVVDVEKSSDYSHAGKADALASKKLFFHAYETLDEKMKATSLVEYLDTRRPSMPAGAREKNKYALLDQYTENRRKRVTRNSFVQIGKFKKGDIAGLHEQNMGPKEGVINLSLVSEGSEVVQVHKQRFLVLAGPQTLAEIQVLFATYRQISDVQEEVAEKQNWTHYRKNFVNALMGDLKRERALLQPRGNPNLTLARTVTS